MRHYWCSGSKYIFSLQKKSQIRLVFDTSLLQYKYCLLTLYLPWLYQKNQLYLVSVFYTSPKWKANPTMIKYRPSLLRETRGRESRGAKTAFYQNQPYQRVAVWEEWECDGFFLYFQFSHSFFTFLWKMFKNHSLIQYFIDMFRVLISCNG